MDRPLDEKSPAAIEMKDLTKNLIWIVKKSINMIYSFIFVTKTQRLIFSRYNHKQTKNLKNWFENKLFLCGNIDGLLLDVVGDVLDLDVDSTFVWDDLDLDDVVVALAARRTHLKIIRCKFLTNFILHQMLETNQIIPSLSYVIHTNKFVNERLK